MGIVFQSSEQGQIVYQSKENHECSTMVANILPPDTPDPRDGSIGQISTFSEYVDVAYQTEGNHECSNMVTNILLSDTHFYPR